MNDDYDDGHDDDDDECYAKSAFSDFFSICMLQVQQACNHSDRSMDKYLKVLHPVMNMLFDKCDTMEKLRTEWNNVPRSVKSLNVVTKEEQEFAVVYLAICPTCEKGIKE